MIQRREIILAHDAPLKLTKLARSLITPVNRRLPNCFPLLAVFVAQSPKIVPSDYGNSGFAFNRANRLACQRLQLCRDAFAAAIEAYVSNEDLEMASRGQPLVFTPWGPTAWRLQWFTGVQGSDYRLTASRILKAAVKAVRAREKRELDEYYRQCQAELKEAAAQAKADAFAAYLKQLNDKLANKRIDNA